MTNVFFRIRNRIQAQGFCGLDDETYAQINYPLRISPAICMIWATFGTYFHSPLVLWALVPFALLGGILRGHPFDVVYNHGLRHLDGTPPLPPYPARRRFACFIATAMLVGAAWSYQAGLPQVGNILGWSLVGAAFVNVSSGFCIPSFLCRLACGKVSCQ